MSLFSLVTSPHRDTRDNQRQVVENGHQILEEVNNGAGDHANSFAVVGAVSHFDSKSGIYIGRTDFGFFHLR